MKDIVAVVVTYNRKELLIECLNAIKNQTYPVSKIVVIDNNSTDGTDELFKDRNMFKNDHIHFKKLPKNIGGAGGFHEGIKYSSELNPNWLWIMDDDTIPEPDSLEMFMKNLDDLGDKKISFLASSVFGLENEAMNVPDISKTLSMSGYPDWYFELNKGLVKIESATFVSLLINNNAIKKIGLPMRDYFIWGDDTEYTLRLTRYYGDAFLSGNSKVIHKRKAGKALSLIDEDNKSRIPLYFYYIRNNLINTKEYNRPRKLIKEIIWWELNTIKILFSPKVKFKFRKIMYAQKALWAFSFNKYDHKGFKNRINK